MGIKRQMKRSGGYRKMSQKNGYVNAMFNMSDIDGMDELVREHPEIQEMLDMLTDEYGGFDASVTPASNCCIIHAHFWHGERLHVLMIYDTKQIVFMDDAKWDEMKRNAK